MPQITRIRNVLVVCVFACIICAPVYSDNQKRLRSGITTKTISDINLRHGSIYESNNSTSSIDPPGPGCTVCGFTRKGDLFIKLSRSIIRQKTMKIYVRFGDSSKLYT